MDESCHHRSRPRLLGEILDEILREFAVDGSLELFERDSVNLGDSLRHPVVDRLDEAPFDPREIARINARAFREVDETPFGSQSNGPKAVNE
jgi:hypothetical protein